MQNINLPSGNKNAQFSNFLKNAFAIFSIIRNNSKLQRNNVPKANVKFVHKYRIYIIFHHLSDYF